MGDTNSATPYAGWKGWTATGFGQLTRGDDDYFRREVREIARRSAVRRVLEVGFGNGTFLAYCRSQHWDVTGTELLTELVDFARTGGFDAYTADELSILPDAAYDLVVALDVFEHIPPDSSVEFLTALAAKIAPGGALLLRFPNADSWIGNPLQNGDATHVNAIGALKMQFYAQEAGLRVVRLRATKRRGFRTSLVHGVHRYTAGVAIKAIAGVAKALYFPSLPVVLSSPAVVCILRRNTDESP